MRNEPKRNAMTSKDVCKKLKMHPRVLQLICKRLNVPKQGNRYVISKADLKRIKENRTEQSETNTNFVEFVTEQFTPAEYEEFRKRLIEYATLQDRKGDLKNEIEYLRKSLDKQNEQTNLILATIRERNAIDYKDKLG